MLYTMSHVWNLSFNSFLLSHVFLYNILCNQIRHFNILFYEKVLKELNTMKTDVYRCLNLINWRQMYSDYFLVYWKHQTMTFAQIYILYQLKAWFSCFTLHLLSSEFVTSGKKTTIPDEKKKPISSIHLLQISENIWLPIV